MMRISILAIGSELLAGSVTDTNSIFIAGELKKSGYSVKTKMCVRDNPDDLNAALKYLGETSDIIIITGGLGPTDDDVTRQCVAGFTENKLVFDQAIWEEISNKFSRNRIKIADENRKQAYIIEGSMIIPNNAGTAPGFIVKGPPVISAFPGVPSELEQMFYFFLDFLKSSFGRGSPGASVFVNTIGLPESYLDDECRKIAGESVKLGTIANSGQVTLRFDFTNGQDYTSSLGYIKSRISGLPVISKRIYSYEPGMTIENLLVKKMIDMDKRAFFAESCTGGLISKLISDNPGSSAVLLGSIVCYSNDIKTSCLGVKQQTLVNSGAVSFETAEEMAGGLVKLGRSDYCISVTGIAGPDGGTPGKPVGTVFICFGKKGPGSDFIYRTYSFMFPGTRDMIRKRTAIKVFEMLWLDLTYGVIDDNINSIAMR